jgi:anthranilate phosphoribosyltransferase
VRGETVDEITAGAKYLRQNVKYFEQPFDIIDTCGTGGDGSHTYNISTTVAFVLAGAGAKVAKHGGRASSSKSGSSDVLLALGVNIDANHDQCRKALTEAGLCFLFAPNHHAVMAHAAPVRKDLKIRTIFNLLGPLSNPAFAKRQILGVYDKKWLVPMASVLAQLGVKKAWTVHGLDGLDEISLNTDTMVCELKDGHLREFILNPQMLGFKPCAKDALSGGGPEVNASALRALLEGKPGPYRDIVVLNAAAGLVIADPAKDMTQGIDMANLAIDSGKALSALNTLIKVTNEK